MSLECPSRPAVIRAFNAGGAALQCVGLARVRLDADELLDEASRRTGLDDFGDDSFREPLRRLLASYETEARLNLSGRIAARQDTLQLLVNRLLLERDRKRNPGIAEQEIRRPLFIVGLPRSGTTLIHSLLAQDPANRVPMGWEVMYPSPPPESAHFESDPRIARAEKRMRWLDRLAPGFRAIHAVSARGAQECIAITGHSFASSRFDTTHDIPSYKKWLDGHDQRPAYAYHRRFLQHLMWRCPAERWVLKSPTHVFRLDEIFATYPDARIVQTHRDPLKAMASVASLKAVLRGAFSDSIDLAGIGAQVIQRWAEGFERTMEARENGVRDRFFDVHYRDLSDNPIMTVRRIYARFGLALTHDAEARMRRYLAENPKNKHGKHNYSLARFGLDDAEVYRRFEPYFRHFGIEPEIASVT